MEKSVIVINLGSSSKKYSLYQKGEVIVDAHFENDKEKFLVTYTGDGPLEISSDTFKGSFFAFCDAIKKRGYLRSDSHIYAVGMRIVAPGEYFTEDHVVDNAFLENLENARHEDKAHIEPIQREITLVREAFGAVRIVAISDSAFHSTMKDVAKKYALPQSFVSKYGLRRFGYHGISLSGIVSTLSSRPWGLEKRAIICHLGSGASVTAVSEGRSIDTSMGYSPLDGLIMSSRSGSIDVGAILHVAEKKSVEELQDMLYRKSGLLAISELSSDMRVLIDAEKDGHAGAHHAIEAFAYAIRKYIGAYVSVLGGVDVLIFSGTIGERSFIIRERICRELGWLNVYLDDEKNTHAKSGEYINKEGTLGVCVIHSDEDLEIMKRVATILG